EKCSEVYPTTMLIATLNDMLAVDAAFAEMASMPAKITSGIEKAMLKIKAVQGSGSLLQNLKADMTRKMSSSLAEKIDALAEENETVTPDQQQQLCSAFDSITGGGEERPEACADF